MVINDKSSKDEIVSNSLELIDTQSETIGTLKAQVNTLFGVLGVPLIWNILF